MQRPPDHARDELDAPQRALVIEKDGDAPVLQSAILAEQEFSQIGSVLPGNAGDQTCRHIMQPYSREQASRAPGGSSEIPPVAFAI